MLEEAQPAVRTNIILSRNRTLLFMCSACYLLRVEGSEDTDQIEKSVYGPSAGRWEKVQVMSIRREIIQKLLAPTYNSSSNRREDIAAFRILFHLRILIHLSILSL